MALTPAHTALLLIDWQERLFDAMPEGPRADARIRAGHLRWMAGELGLPILASEQYPRGLGPTLPELTVPNPIEKLCFSALRAPEFARRLADAFSRESGARDVIVCGMETHICVAQTCRDLHAAGFRVWLVADACLSRKKLDWRLGIDRIRGDGATVVTAEAVLFELLGEAGTPLFKELSRRVR